MSANNKFQKKGVQQFYLDAKIPERLVEKRITRIIITGFDCPEDAYQFNTWIQGQSKQKSWNDEKVKNLRIIIEEDIPIPDYDPLEGIE